MVHASSSTAEARVIDGRAVAAEVTEAVGRETRRLLAETGMVPGLAVVLVGNNPASQVYVASKSKTAAALGFHSVQRTLPAATTEAQLLAVVDALNRDPAIHGILVQLPLPPHLDKTPVIDAIRPEKDVDGLHPVNAGRLSNNDPRAMVPCTPAGCLVLIKRSIEGPLAGRRAIVVGRSNLVGKPMAQLLLGENCTVTMAHSHTRDLPAAVRGADIVVAAIGRPEMIGGDWIGRGATVIDVGMNRIAAPERGAGKTRLVGDVAYEAARRHAAAITPVPGGVGPMTIAMLMANTLTAACQSVGRAMPVLEGKR
jgi:methylenetetrahydrofolate dehydrogenase (NADP+)/methenyltetrahydrofolate cyclohydrolase